MDRATLFDWITTRMKILIFGLPGSGKTTLAKPLADLMNGVHINAKTVREKYNDWDFSPIGRNRQASRMRYLADGVSMTGQIAVCDFVCPTPLTRYEFNADFTIWMDTIKECPYDDTNAIFQNPNNVDYHVEKWFDDAHQQLLPVVQRWWDIHK